MSTLVNWQSSDTQYIDVNGYRIEVRCTGIDPANGFLKSCSSATDSSGFDTSRADSSGAASSENSLSLNCNARLSDNEEDRLVIVLLHEGLGCVELWRQFPDLLSARTNCPVVAYSRTGYGSSDPATLPRPLDYMSREAIDVLPLVLDAIGARRFILVGHSDGATIAAINAGSVADYRIRGLVLLAPHFFTETNALLSIAQIRDQFINGGLRDKLARYHKAVDVAFNGWCDAWLDPGFVEWNVADCIDYIRIPVLAIQGTEDEYGTVAQIDEIRSRIYAPFEENMIDECGHSPHLEAPDATLSSIALLKKSSM